MTQWNPTERIRITLYVRWNRWMFGVEWGRWDYGLEHCVCFSLGPVNLEFRREIARPIRKKAPEFAAKTWHEILTHELDKMEKKNESP